MRVPEEIGPQAEQIDPVLTVSENLDAAALRQLTTRQMDLQDEDSVAAFADAVTALEIVGREDALDHVIDQMQDAHHQAAQALLPEWFGMDIPEGRERESAIAQLATQLSAAAAGVVAALAARDLVDETGFTHEDYRTLTRTWTSVVGPVHSDDEQRGHEM